MTLEELLQRIKGQDFGPEDSTVVSSIAHPVKAADKLMQFVQNSMQTAAGMSTPESRADNPMPWLAPSQEQQAQAGLDLAGLVQTGAMPFGATGAGTVGSIRRPQDIVFPEVLPTIARHWGPNGPEEQPRPAMSAVLDKVVKNYYQKNWATDNDVLVKHVDSGKRLAFVPPDGQSSGQRPLGLWTTGAGLNKLGAKYGAPPVPRSAVNNYEILEALQAGRPLGKAQQRFADNLQNTADFIRDKLGTGQSAATPAGKFFENINDMDALSFKKISPRHLKNPMMRVDSPEDAAYEAARQKLVNSEYYKKNAKTVNMYAPGVSIYPTSRVASPSGLYMEHAADVVPYNERMSLTDALQHTVRYDEAAFHKAQAEKFNEATQKALAKKTDIRQFDDGHSWAKLTDPEALTTEGKIQGHCVGNYCRAVENGLSEIYSLRNKENRPVLTLEWDPKGKKVVQTKGKFNAKPTKEQNKYLPSIIDYLSKGGL
jgi:hypothetical protein